MLLCCNLVNIRCFEMESSAIKLRRILMQEVGALRQYGVDNIGYRYFLKDGRSYGLPTNDSWYENKRDQGFYDIMKPFLSDELLNLKKENIFYVSRSSDHEHSEYIECLKSMKMENSLGMYKFQNERIDSLFFIFESFMGEKKDLIFNNMHNVERHINKILNNLSAIAKEIELYDNYEFVLDEAVKQELFDDNTKSKRYPRSVKVFTSGGEVYLTNVEFKMLKALKYSISNKGLSEDLGISIKTVEKHISSLRQKLCAQSKDDLLKFAQSSQVTTIFDRNLV